MALGVPNTGPYSAIRTLYQQIESYKYEISLIDQGVKRGSKTGYQKRIAADRAEIKKIREQIKKDKSR